MKAVRRRAETPISEFTVKILTALLYSSTQISYVVRIFWRSVGIYQHFGPYFHYSCAETPIAARPAKIQNITVRFCDLDFLKGSDIKFRQNPAIYKWVILGAKFV